MEETREEFLNFYTQRIENPEVVHMPENYHFQTPHCLIRQLGVNDKRVDIVVEHFDVTRQMLSTLSWSALMTDEQDSGGFFMANFHALHKTMEILKQDLYYLCCDSALPPSKDTVIDCRHLTQQFERIGWWDQETIQHYVKQFLTWTITSISQRLHPGSWLQDDVGISRHDALDNYYFRGGIIVVAERYGMIEVSSYPCLYLMDGC